MVEAFTPGIARLGLETMPHPFRYLRLKALIAAATIPHRKLRGTYQWIEPGSMTRSAVPIRIEGWSAGPEKACAGQGWQDHVHVVWSIGLMDGVRAHVAEHNQQRANLTLNVQVPVHGVIRFGVLFDSARLDLGRVETSIRNFLRRPERKIALA